MWPRLYLGVGQAWEVHPRCFLTLGCATGDQELRVLPAQGELSSVHDFPPAPAGNELSQLQQPHRPDHTGPPRVRTS